MADPHGRQRDDVLRPADAAERAGAFVTDQVRSIIDAAQARAGEIERSAHEEAGEIRAAAHEAARRVAADADRLGRGALGATSELTLLLADGSKEVDALQARLDRVRSRSGPEPPGGGTAAEGEATALEASSLGRGAGFRESNGDQAEPNGDQAKAPDEREPEGPAAPLEPRAPAGPQEPAEAEEDIAADTVIGEARGLMELARARVRGKPDVELAETYDLAVALVGRVADPAESVYWQAMLESTVAEAAARPEFGQPAPGVGDRRAQRRRAQGLRPLLEARRQQVEEAAGGDDGP